jgi:hypothetical protein
VRIQNSKGKESIPCDKQGHESKKWKSDSRFEEIASGG